MEVTCRNFLFYFKKMTDKFWLLTLMDTEPLKFKVMDAFYQIYIQLVWSVRRRQRLILPKFKEEMNKYITGIIKNRGHKLMAINSTRDHIHILVSMSRDLHISKLVEEIKSVSSKFINERKFLRQRF